MKEQLIMQIVSEVQKDPSFMRAVIDACTYGIIENNKIINQKLIKAEKTSFMLMNTDMTVLHSDENIQDMVDSLNNSHFNGRKQEYTIKEVKKVLN